MNQQYGNIMNIVFNKGIDLIYINIFIEKYFIFYM